MLLGCMFMKEINPTKQIKFLIYNLFVMDQKEIKNSYILGNSRLQSQLSYINPKLELQNVAGTFHIISDSSIHHQQKELMNFKLNNQSLTENIRDCLKQADLWSDDPNSIGYHFEYYSNKKWWMIRNSTTVDDMLCNEKKTIIIRLRLLHTKREYY